MNNLLLDLRFAVRTLRKNAGFTVLAVLALALGIGTNTAIFSVVHAVLLRPLAYRDPDRLTVLFGTDLKRHDIHDVVSHPTFLAWKNRQRSFEDLAAFGGSTFDLSGENEPEQIEALRVSPGLLPLLGVAPQLGRNFTPDEEQSGKNHVVIVSHGIWTRRFGSDAAVYGKTIKLTGETYTVIGVMPATFRFPADRPIDVWVPLPPDPSWGHGFLRVAGRLRSGTTLPQAQAEMDTIARQLELEQPADQKGFGVNVMSMHEQLVGDTRPVLLIFLGAVGMVLLIACANVANMFLARATARQREISIRAALGASRLRLVRQWLTESLVLAIAGGAAGLLLAYWGSDALVAALARLNVAIPGLDRVQVSAPVLAFTLVLSLASGLLFGLAPAVSASQVALTDAMSVTKTTRRGMAGFLVVAEVALSLVLLTGAGLLLRSFILLRSVSPGFRPSQLLTLRIDLPRTAFREPHSRGEFFAQALQKIENLPGVRNASLVNTLPLSGDSSTESFRIAGGPRAEGDLRSAGFCVISPRYLQAMGIPLLSGRAFDDRDTAAGPLVALVNRTMARRVWPGENPIGKHISILNKDREVVGVVGDVRHKGLNTEPRPEMYTPYPQDPPSGATFVLQGDGNPSTMAPGARAAIWAVNRDLPITGVRTVEQVLADSVAPERLSSILVGIFAALALVLAAAGIYGVLSYSVSRRTREIGIRMALGARRAEVLAMVLRQALRLVGIGLVVGLTAAFALTRVFARYLYGITPTDPSTFAFVCAFLAAVALGAAFVPARRATRVDPTEALRYQ